VFPHRSVSGLRRQLCVGWHRCNLVAMALTGTCLGERWGRFHRGWRGGLRSQHRVGSCVHWRAPWESRCDTHCGSDGAAHSVRVGIGPIDERVERDHTEPFVNTPNWCCKDCNQCGQRLKKARGDRVQMWQQFFQLGFAVSTSSFGERDLAPCWERSLPAGSARHPPPKGSGLRTLEFCSASWLCGHCVHPPY
jgi:hypothetical protein